MPNIIGYKDLSNLYIKPAAEPTRTISDIDLKSASEPERVLNPIVSESYMRQYIEEHGGITPTGNIVITENTTEPLDIAQYATATVNVSGGGGDLNLLHTTLNIICSEDSFGPMTSIDHFFDVVPCAIIDNSEITPVVDTGLLKDYIPTLEAGASYTIDLYYVSIDTLQVAIKSPTLVTVSDLNNISFASEIESFVIYTVTDTTANSSITLTVKTTN